MDQLHPTFRARLDALADAIPELQVVSGVRSQAHQQRLYDLYRAGRGNLAANPSRTIGPRTMFGESFVAKGSWHMVQATGWGYAADLNYGALSHAARAKFDEVTPYTSQYVKGAPAPFGLYRTVEGRNPEPWHVQPAPIVTQFDSPKDGFLMALTDAEQAKLADDVKNIRAALRKISPQIDGLVRTSTETAQALEAALAEQGVHVTPEQIRAALDGLVLRVES